MKLHLLDRPIRFLPCIWIQKLKYKYMFLSECYPVSIRQLSLPNCKGESASTTRTYPVLTWHLKREIKIHIYVSKRMLSAFYKAVVYIQTLKVEVHLQLALPGSYLAFGTGN